MSLDKSYAQDLSPVAVRKAVIKTAIQKPLVVYPLALSMVGVCYGVISGFGLLAAIPIASGAIISSGSYFWNVLVKGPENANNYIQKYRLILEQQLNLTLNNMKSELDSIGNKDGYQQVTLFQQKYSIFKEVLNKKLDTEELTYNRYLSIAEQVFLGGLDNIENASLAIRSVSSIDSKRISTEIASLSKSDSDNLKKDELESRLMLYQQQMKRAKKLLLDNEAALTQLDQVTSKIANINTKQQRAEVVLEDAMAELQRLIARTETYSNS